MRRTQSLPARYLFLIAFFITLVLALGLYSISNAILYTNFDLFRYLFFSAVLVFLVSGIFALASVGAWIFHISTSRSRARSLRASQRSHAKRQRWLRNRRVQDSNSIAEEALELETEQNGEVDELVADVNRDLPDWLIPLLKNRPMARAIHEDLVASSQTQAESETRLQSHIKELDTEIVVIRYPEEDHLQMKTVTTPDIADTTLPKPSSAVLDAEVEKEAILNLLGALELQHNEGRITKRFYKRKRKQLRNRLAEVNKRLT
ncbi:MAG: hypothetical protein ACFFDU_09745 [Candidatus Thorarchaeota archaeon]